MCAISRGSALSRRPIRWRNTPTSHVGVEIVTRSGCTTTTHAWPTAARRQLCRGLYLRSLRGRCTPRDRQRWPGQVGSEVNLFILPGIATWRANGHSCRRGQAWPSRLLKDNPGIAFKYSLVWLSQIRRPGAVGQVGITTHSGRSRVSPGITGQAFGQCGHCQVHPQRFQIIDGRRKAAWPGRVISTLEFVKFIQQSIRELSRTRRLTGIVYHLGENDMSIPTEKSRRAVADDHRAEPKDLGQPELKWFVSQQPPTDEKGVNRIDVVADMEKVAAADTTRFTSSCQFAASKEAARPRHRRGDRAATAG